MGGDFKSCFDTLSHEFILEQIHGFPHFNLVKRFLKAGYVDNGAFIILMRVLLKEDCYLHYWLTLHYMEWKKLWESHIDIEQGLRMMRSMNSLNQWVIIVLFDMLMIFGLRSIQK